MKKIAVINDLSGFGKCSLSVALPIISACGIQCCPLTTGVFSNQTCYPDYESVDFTEYMPSFIEAWKKLSVRFDGILTGFIPNSRQGKIISEFIEEFKSDNTLVVVDPVMGDEGNIYPCYDKESLKSISRLVEKADVITPNLTELCILANKDYFSLIKTDSENIIDTVFELSKKIGKTVITTGIKTGDSIANLIYSDGKCEIVKSKRFEGSFSGTGDIMASLVSAKLVQGESPKQAVETASHFISEAVELTLNEASDKYMFQNGVHFESLLKQL